jgi:hypothetical protein
MPEVKNVLQSKTIWGAIILLASQVLKLATDTEVTAEEQEQLVGGITGVATMITDLIGLVMVVWGRATADKKITLGKGTPNALIAGVLTAGLLVAAMGCSGVPARAAKSFTDVVIPEHLAFIRGEKDPADLTPAQVQTREALLLEHKALVDSIYADTFGAGGTTPLPLPDEPYDPIE